jgi:uroporphyrinogen-III decarboxylase
VDFPASEWESSIAAMEKIDRSEYFATLFYAPGIFEQSHYLMSITDCLVAFYEEPEAMKELIEYIADFELRYAEQVCKYLKPDALFHHDDWGTQISTFISPDMFEEFLLPPYKKLYGYYKSHGVEIIMHHSDSYAATLVPYMIEMGIDIWQGVMKGNNIPELLKKYPGQITFMGGINSADVDFSGWTQEIVAREVMRACTECGKLYFIPQRLAGLPMSNYPGVYQALTER